VAIVAPPGYGKTTLLAEWSKRNGRASAWVSLDEHDDDPSAFLSCVAAALDRIQPIDPAVLRSFASPAVLDFGGVLRRFVVAVSSMYAPFALAIDHVEVLQNEWCRAAVAELALNLPRGSQLALASRTDPPIPIAKLRAQGLVVDIGMDDLAMDAREARELFAAVDVALSDAAVTDLLDRTEGWPVGLYLATVAAKAEGPRPGLGVAFEGDDRFLVRIVTRRGNRFARLIAHKIALGVRHEHHIADALGHKNAQPPPPTGQ